MDEQSARQVVKAVERIAMQAVAHGLGKRYCLVRADRYAAPAKLKNKRNKHAGRTLRAPAPTARELIGVGHQILLLF